MCSPNIRKLILDILDEYVAEERIFTSFDITKEVRSRTIEKVLHRDVKKEIEKFWSNAIDYKRVLAAINVIHNPQVFIYAPINRDINDHPMVIKEEEKFIDYDEDVIDNSTISIKDENIVKLTAENRLNIPKKFLDRVSPVGGSYDIIINGSLIPHKPDINGRVRIGLTKLGIKSEKCRIEIDNESNSINIQEL